MKSKLLQIDFRLTGDSNIAIAIELPFGGELTQMVPKIKDLHVAGTARVILAPLCADIPCFGASVVSLKQALFTFSAWSVSIQARFTLLVLALKATQAFPGDNEINTNHTSTAL